MDTEPRGGQGRGPAGLEVGAQRPQQLAPVRRSWAESRSSPDRWPGSRSATRVRTSTSASTSWNRSRPGVLGAQDSERTDGLVPASREGQPGAAGSPPVQRNNRPEPASRTTSCPSGAVLSSVPPAGTSTTAGAWAERDDRRGPAERLAAENTWSTSRSPARPPGPRTANLKARRPPPRRRRCRWPHTQLGRCRGGDRPPSSSARRCRARRSASASARSRWRASSGAASSAARRSASRAHSGRGVSPPQPTPRRPGGAGPDGGDQPASGLPGPVGEVDHVRAHLIVAGCRWPPDARATARGSADRGSPRPPRSIRPTKAEYASTRNDASSRMTGPPTEAPSRRRGRRGRRPAPRAGGRGSGSPGPSSRGARPPGAPVRQPEQDETEVLGRAVRAACSPLTPSSRGHRGCTLGRARSQQLGSSGTDRDRHEVAEEGGSTGPRAAPRRRGVPRSTVDRPALEDGARTSSASSSSRLLSGRPWRRCRFDRRKHSPQDTPIEHRTAGPLVGSLVLPRDGSHTATRRRRHAADHKKEPP